MATPREPITPAMKIDCLLFRYSITCGICGHEIGPGCPIEWDHVHALVHGGPHIFTNLRPVHEKCHKAKTKADIQANAKVKRILNPRTSKRPMKSSGRKIPSRPFPKRPEART
jgi:5-methylcytosine-specific restriction endonuclease McrA